MEHLDFGRSFTYSFEDSEWLKKLMIGGIVNIIPIVNLAAYGYAVETLSRIAKSGFGVLPEWDDFGKKFLDGLLLGIAFFVWALPGIIVVGIGTFPLIVNLIVSKEHTPQAMPFVLSLSIGFMWILFVAFMYPAIMMNFSRTRSISSCFEFSNIFSLVTFDIGTYILGIVAYIGATLLIMLLSMIPYIGFLLAPIGGFYVCLVVAGAFGQLLSKTPDFAGESTAGV